MRAREPLEPIPSPLRALLPLAHRVRRVRQRHPAVRPRLEPVLLHPPPVVKRVLQVAPPQRRLHRADDVVALEQPVRLESRVGLRRVALRRVGRQREELADRLRVVHHASQRARKDRRRRGGVPRETARVGGGDDPGRRVVSRVHALELQAHHRELGARSPGERGSLGEVVHEALVPAHELARGERARRRDDEEEVPDEVRGLVLPRDRERQARGVEHRDRRAPLGVQAEVFAQRVDPRRRGEMQLPPLPPGLRAGRLRARDRDVHPGVFAEAVEVDVLAVEKQQRVEAEVVDDGLALARQVELLLRLVLDVVHEVLAPGRRGPRGAERDASRPGRGSDDRARDPHRRDLRGVLEVVVDVREPFPRRGGVRGRVRGGAELAARARRRFRLVHAEVLALLRAVQHALVLDDERALAPARARVDGGGHGGDHALHLPPRVGGHPRLEVLPLDRDRVQAELRRHPGLTARRGIGRRALAVDGRAPRPGPRRLAAP